MNDYERWMKERELDAQAAARMRNPPMQKSSLEADVYVPVLQSVGISTALFISGSGLTWLFGGAWVEGFELFKMGLKVGAAAALVSLSGCVVVFVGQHRQHVVQPLQMMWAKIESMMPATPPPEQEQPYLVIRGGKPPARLVDNITAHQQPDITPQAASTEIKELYDFICACWQDKCVSRSHAQRKGFPHKTWYKFVAGKRGTSDVGILAKAGIVKKDGAAWVICASLQDAFSINDELLEYAGKMANFNGAVGAVRSGARQGNNFFARRGKR